MQRSNHNCKETNFYDALAKVGDDSFVTFIFYYELPIFTSHILTLDFTKVTYDKIISDSLQ